MNAVAFAFLATSLALTAWACVSWAARNPVFQVRRIVVSGETHHSSQQTLRANVLPKLRGSFFSIDLANTRVAFEQVPWVRRAIVRRDFPNQLKVELQEHSATAFFGAESESKLINTFGEVFEANLGDVVTELPRLIGPETQAYNLLQTWRRLAPLLDPLDLTMDQLELTPQGSWRATLDNGALIELGRGSDVELGALLQQFVSTITQTAGQIGRKPQDLESADLRYPQGYAIRLRGVTTQAANQASTSQFDKKQN